MSEGLVIRRAQPGENDSVHALVQAIADETFAYLFAPSPVPIGEANWLSAWLALSGEEIVGVTMTQNEWVSDLWVRCDRRRIGVGGELLAHAEREIRSVDTAHFAFEWSSQILGPSSSIKSTAGEFSVNSRMRSSAIRCSK
jgi:hypothetical protein